MCCRFSIKFFSASIPCSMPASSNLCSWSFQEKVEQHLPMDGERRIKGKDQEGSWRGQLCINELQKLKSCLTLCRKIFVFFPQSLTRTGITCCFVSNSGSVWHTELPCLCPPFSSDSLNSKIHIPNYLIFTVIGSWDFNLFKCKRKDELGKLNLNYSRFCSGSVSIPA